MKVIQRICPVFTPGLDDKLEVKVFKGKLSPKEIQTLRGLYDSTHTTPLVSEDVDVSTLTEEDIAKYSKILSDFRKEVSKKDIQDQKLAAIKAANTSVSAAAIVLDETYRGATKIRRINMIAEIFHKCLEDFKRVNGLNNMSNTEVITNYFGSPLDFLLPSKKQTSDIQNSTIYASLRRKYIQLKKVKESGGLSQYEMDKINHAISELENILKNKTLFLSLCIMAASQIKDNEGIKLGVDLSYCATEDQEEINYQEIEAIVTEETKKDGWMEVHDEISSFNMLSRAVKSVLKFIPMYEYDSNGNVITENGVPVKRKDDLELPIYEDALTLHRALLDVVGSVDTEASMLKAIEELAKINPSFKHVHDRLKADPELLSAFRQEYYKTYIEYRSYNTKGGVMKGFVLSGSFVSKDTIVKNWITNLNKGLNILTTSIFSTEALQQAENEENQITKVVFDREKTKEFLSFIKEYFVPLEGDIFSRTKYKNANTKERKDILLKVLEYLNIQVSPDTLTALLAGNKASKIIKELAKIYTGGYILDKAYTISASEYLKEGVGKEKATFLLDSISTILTIVDSAKPRSLTKKVFWQGKMIFNHILPSLLSNIIDSLKRLSVNSDALNAYIENEFLCSSQFRSDISGETKIHNRLLSDLYQDKSLLSVVDDALSKIGISRTLGTNDKDFSQFTASEHLEALMTDFFRDYRTGAIVHLTEEKFKELKVNGGLYPKVKYYIEGKPYYYTKEMGKKKLPKVSFGNFSTFILGDANQLKQVKLPIYSYNECVEGLCDLAYSEIEYYKQRVAENEKLDSAKVESQIRTDRIFGYLPFLNDVPELQNIGSIPLTADIKKIIKDNIEKFLLGEVDDEGNIITRGEVHKIIDRIKDAGLESKFEEMFSKTYPTVKEGLLETAVRDFVANYALNLGCIQQISTISASMFDGSKDFAKRNKGIHSNGKQLNTRAWNPFRKQHFGDDDQYQKVVIMQEVALQMEEVDPKFLDYVERILGTENAKNYRKAIKSTDGQGYRLIDSYYKIKVMSGEAKDTKITEWYTKYKELQGRCRADNRTTFNEEEIAELEAIGYTPQPLKIITQAVNKVKINNDDTLLVPQQHKYAEVILIPELLPENSRLKAIAEAMQSPTDTDGNTRIDMVVFDTGVKVGSYGAVNVYKNEDGTQKSFDEVKDALSESLAPEQIHYVDLKYVKMQTNTPEHIHDSRSFGTQLRKIILQGINKGGKYGRYFAKFAGKTVKISKNKSFTAEKATGKHLIQFVNSLICSNYIEDFERVNGVVKDKKSLSKTLISQLVLGARGNLNDILAYSLEGDDFFAPLFGPIREHDAAANILSIFKKGVNKQRMLGGSAVQASAFGITEKEESDSLKYIFEEVDGEDIIVGAECEMAWDLRITNIDGSETELKMEDWCNADGTLKVGKILLPSDEEYKKYSMYKTKDGVVYKPLIEMQYPDILRLIAYRVPTEDFYSVMNLQVVRFTKKTATGGTIKVPPQGVAQAGFDFDIDKLYFIRKEFRERKPFFRRLQLTHDERTSIIEQIYKDHPEFISKVGPLTEESYSQSQLYDIFRQIYEDHDDLYKELVDIRDSSGDWRYVKDKNGKKKKEYFYPLNHYFENSNIATKQAKKRGFETVADYKQFLVEQAANELEYIPETYTIVKDGYMMLNEDAITQAGFTKNQVFEEAAKKLGITLKENVNERFVEYDVEKTPLHNTRTARNNMLFGIIWDRMRDPETARMRLTTGGFDKARDAARFIREIMFNRDKLKGKPHTVEEISQMAATTKDPEPDYSVLSVDTLIRYNEMNQIADKLIGVFANHNSNAMMTSLMDKLSLTGRPILFGSLLKSGVKLYRGNTESTEPLGKELLADTIEFRDESGKLISSTNILTNVHELIAAAVDAVKDPVLNYLGLTTMTATAAALLGRLGYSAKDVGLLFNQPIVKEVYKVINSGVSVQEAIRRTKERISNKGKIATSNASLTEEVLISGLVEDDVLTTQASTQLAVLELLSKILGASDALNSLVATTKNTASNAVSSSFAKIYYIIHSFKRMFKYFKGENAQIEARLSDDARDPDTPISFNYDILHTDRDDYLDAVLESPYAYEQVAFDCNRAFVESCSNEFPYETQLYKDIREQAYAFSLYDNMTEETIGELHRDILLMTLSTRGSSFFDPYARIKLGEDTKLISEYCLHDFAKILYETINSNDNPDRVAYYQKLCKEYPFFNYVEVMLSEDKEDSYTIYISGIKDKQKDGKYELSSLFEEVFFSKDPNIAAIGTLLVYYHYFYNGFGYGMSSFTDIITPKIEDALLVNKEGETYNEVLKMLLDETITFDAETFVRMFVQNHPDNTDFVFIPKNKLQEKIRELFKPDKRSVYKDSEGIKHTTIELNVNDAIDNYLANKTKEKGIEVIKPKRFININGELWEAISIDGTTIKYEKLYILSNGGPKRYTTGSSGLIAEAIPTPDSKTPKSDNTVITGKEVQEQYSAYGITDSAARRTFNICMKEVLGIDSSSALPSKYVALSKEEVYEELAKIFTEQKIPISVLSEDGKSLETLC